MNPMSWFENISVGKKLIGGFLFVSLIIVMVGGLGFIRISANNKNFESMAQKDLEFLQASEELKIFALEHRRYEKDFFLNIGEKEKQIEYIKKFETVSSKTRILIKQIESITKNNPHLSIDVKNAITQAQRAYFKYREGFLELTKIVLSDDSITPQKANGLMKPLKENIYLFESNIEIVLQSSVDLIHNEAKTVISDGKKSQTIIGVLSIIGVVISLVLGVTISLSVTRPIKEAVVLANKMAQGDLTHQIKATQKNEIGQLMMSLGNMLANFSESIRASIEASGMLAEGASEQAASLEETSSSLEEMSSMTKQNAQNADQANSLMTEASTTIGQAIQSMEKLTASMGEITQASDETSKIIKTIDEIAFQTNLLALNAAVEAARAGEAGAGFAVVADEVRNLAMRAAKAAKNTAVMIEGTVKKVADGSIVVEQTNQAFIKVASSVVKGSALVSEIAAASNEQAEGIEQITKAMSQIDIVTQQTAAGAEEMASSMASFKVRNTSPGLIVSGPDRYPFR